MRGVIVAGLLAGAAVIAMVVNLGLLGSTEASSDPVGKLMPSSYGLEQAVLRPGAAGVGAAVRAHHRRKLPRRGESRTVKAIGPAAPAPATPPVSGVSHPRVVELRPDPALPARRGGERQQPRPHVEVRTRTVTVATPAPQPGTMTAPSAPTTSTAAAAAAPPPPPPTTSSTRQTDTTGSSDPGQHEPHDD